MIEKRSPHASIFWKFCAALFIIFNFNACSFDTPEAPRWDTSFTIPLINRYYTMDELIEDEPSLSVDSSGQLHYLFDTELDAFQVGDQLTFDDFSDSYRTSIGQLTLNSPGGANLNLTLLDIYPAAALFDGQTVVVPPFNFDLGKRVLDPYNDFDWIEVSSGFIRLLLQNDLLITLGRPLHFAIYDSDADTLVASADFNGEIGPGELLNQTIDLSGKKFSNELSVEISGASPGSNNQPVLVDVTDSFNLNVIISSLQVAAARARIGEQEVTDSDAAMIDAGASISSSKIKRGTVRLQINSQLPIPATLDMTMPDFKLPDGTPFTQSFVLSGAGSTSRALDFAGYSFAPDAAPLGQQTVKLQWAVQSPGSGGSYVTVQSTDEVAVNFSIEDMVFSEVTGTFAGEAVQIDPKTYSVDVPDGIDSVNFDNVQLDIVLRNGIAFPAQIDLSLDGVNEFGRHVFLRVQEPILPGGANGAPAETHIVLNKTNSAVVDFVNALPKSINVSGVAIIGGAGYVGTVRDTDAVSGTVNIDAPLSFSLPAQRVEMESESLEIDDGAREQIRDNLHEGSLDTRISNHLPMGASVSFYFGRSKEAVFTDPVLVIGPVTVVAGEIAAGSGLVNNAVLSKNKISLTEPQLKIFDTTPLYAGVLVDFPGTNGQVVRIVRSDYMDIKAVATVKFTVDSESTD
jgi:hypothetical protein